MNNIDLRVIRENPIQGLGVVVEGEADIARQTAFLQPPEEVKASEACHIGIAVPPQVVKKVDVEVGNAAAP